MRSSPSSSQRPSPPARSGISRRPSLSVAARQSWSSARRSTFPPSAPRALPGCQSHGRGPPRPSRFEHERSRLRRPRTRSRSAGAPEPRQRELLPGDLVTRRRPVGRTTQEESERDESLRGARRVDPDVERPAAEGRAAAAASAPDDVTLASLPLAAEGVEPDEVPAAADPEAAGARADSTPTGRARNSSSCSAGCGVRSGQISPSAQKFGVVRVVAEVSAVGDQSLRRASVRRSPWSTHSQTKPPCSPSWRSNAAQ